MPCTVTKNTTLLGSIVGIISLTCIKLWPMTLTYMNLWFTQSGSRWAIVPSIHVKGRFVRKLIIIFRTQTDCSIWTTTQTDQGLRGSAARQPSVNGDWLSQRAMAIFDPLQNRNPSTDHQMISYRWLRWRPLQLHEIWCASVHEGFWANGWNITNFYLCRFLETHLQFRPVDGFLRMVAQTTWTHARMCLFRPHRP